MNYLKVNAKGPGHTEHKKGRRWKGNVMNTMEHVNSF